MKHIKNLYPYLVCGSFPRGNTWFFLTPNGEVKIEGADEILSLLLPMCNGEIVLDKIIEQVAERIRVEKEEIEDFVQKLFELDILQDKHQFFCLGRNTAKIQWFFGKIFLKMKLLI